LPKNLVSYTQLQGLGYCFGQKLVRSDGEIYWGTESSYTYETGCHTRRRRDILFLEGVQSKEYRLPDTSVVQRVNALCCEVICFLEISNLQTTLSLTNICDSQTFVLVRWFEPHPNNPERDSQYRPVCPGALNINHCLWRYAKSQHVRQSLINRRGYPTAAFGRQSYLFGDTPREQNMCLDKEKNAYFGLISPDTILHKVNMCPCFFPNSSVLDEERWLESVNMI
jgi:hypothetical protein